MTRRIKSGSAGNERVRKDDPYDAYETAPWQVKALIATEAMAEIRQSMGTNFAKYLWWDPCAGLGSLSNTWKAMTGCRMFTSDIRNLPGLDLPGLDFLKMDRDSLPEQPFGIVMNPPFDCVHGNVERFILRALWLTGRYVVVFSRIQLLEGKTRAEKLWSQNKLAWVLPFSRRANLYPEGKIDLRGSGNMMFAWYVFDTEHDSPYWRGELLTAQPEKDMPQQVGKCQWCKLLNHCGHDQEPKEFCEKWEGMR